MTPAMSKGDFRHLFYGMYYVILEQYEFSAYYSPA